MCLSWWVSKAMSTKDLVTFEEAKVDVAWVIQQVLDSLSSTAQLKWPTDESLNDGVMKCPHT